MALVSKINFSHPGGSMGLKSSNAFSGFSSNISCENVRWRKRIRKLKVTVTCLLLASKSPLGSTNRNGRILSG